MSLIDGPLGPAYCDDDKKNTIFLGVPLIASNEGDVVEVDTGLIIGALESAETEVLAAARVLMIRKKEVLQFLSLLKENAQQADLAASAQDIKEVVNVFTRLEEAYSEFLRYLESAQGQLSTGRRVTLMHLRESVQGFSGHLSGLQQTTFMQLQVLAEQQKPLTLLIVPIYSSTNASLRDLQETISQLLVDFSEIEEGKMSPAKIAHLTRQGVAAALDDLLDGF